MKKPTIDLGSLSVDGQRRLLDQVLGHDFTAFIRASFGTVVPGEMFSPNWHIDAMAKVLDRVRLGELRRVIITMPPRGLKSITASVAFPAYVLGHDPTKKIICVSYSAELAIKHSIDCRAVLKSPWFRRAFPNTRIGSEKNTETEILLTRRGGRYATSVGGTLTGRGGDIIVIDDPMKPDEALSDVSRQRVKTWVEGTLMSRLNSKSESAIILVMQRLDMDDLAGVLLDKGGWYHLDLQAIAEEPQSIPLYHGGVHHRSVGELLDPKRDTLADLDNLKRSMGTMLFSAQYQQRPIPIEGNLIKRAWLNFYEHPPEASADEFYVISWDTAMKASQLANYSVGTVWQVQGEICYLREVIRDQYDFPDLKRALLTAKRNWPAATILVEDKGSGTSLIQELRAENVAVISIRPLEDKVTRLFTTQPMFEAGSVFLPRQASWLSTLMTELLAFPNFRTDDQVDSISQALSWIRNHSRHLMGPEIGIIVTPNRPSHDDDFDHEFDD